MKLSGIANLVLALSIASGSSHLGNAMPVRFLWPEGRSHGKMNLDKLKNYGDWPFIPTSSIPIKGMKISDPIILPEK